MPACYRYCLPDTGKQGLRNSCAPLFFFVGKSLFGSPTLGPVGSNHGAARINAAQQRRLPRVIPLALLLIN